MQHQLQMPMLGYVNAKSLGGADFTSNGASSDRDLEPFRILRANLDFLAGDQPLRTIAVTSPLAEEGKSTVAAGLATAAALTGRRVLSRSAIYDARCSLIASTSPRAPG